MARNKLYDPTRPRYEWGNGWKAGDLSEKQAAYITSLCAKCGVEVVSFVGLKKGQAAQLIEELKRKASGDPHSDRYLARDFAEYVRVQQEA